MACFSRQKPLGIAASFLVPEVLVLEPERAQDLAEVNWPTACCAARGPRSGAPAAGPTSVAPWFLGFCRSRWFPHATCFATVLARFSIKFSACFLLCIVSFDLEPFQLGTNIKTPPGPTVVY